MRTLETRRLTLEPQTTAHAEAMFAVLADPAIYEHENGPPLSVEALRARFAPASRGSRRGSHPTAGSGGSIGCCARPRAS